MEWLAYWWVIFPILGVAGGAYKRWESGAKARHQRKLELLRVKSELRQNRAPSPAVTAKPPLPNEESLTRLFAAHDDVTHRWLDYELDVSKLIAYPAMSDGRQPLTAAFLRAKKAADNLRPASPKSPLSPEQLAEYRNAVTDYEVAFDVAEREARRVKDTAFTDAERKRLDTAKRLLSVAIDQAATPNERQLAYKRVRDELDGLIWLSDAAVDELEKKVSLELPRGSTEQTPDATPPAPVRPPRPAGDTAAPGRVIHPKPMS